MNHTSRAALSTTQSQQLYSRAKEIIPGGTQLLSKRPEMFAPGQWPVYYRSAQGCKIVDFDGNSYLDMATMGIGACLLGYADPDVTDAVVRRAQQGAMCTLNSPEEVELAELLLMLHPWAESVRYLRTGGEAMAAAVRIARAASDRDLIAFCGYHGWHDWYLAANRMAAGTDQLRDHLLPGLSAIGVPSQLRGTALPFRYNEIDGLARIVRRQGKDLAAVVMEPTRSVDPAPGFLEEVRELCDYSGAALIMDEISAGWRLALGGAHLNYDLKPDMAVFAKSLSNGHPMAAIIGRSRIMEAAQKTFISSTYWTEAIGPVAALATIRKLQRYNVPSHVDRIGKLLRQGLQRISEQHQVKSKLLGHSAMLSIQFESPASVELLTLYTVRMMEHGILCGGSFYPSWAHREEHVEAYLNAADAVFHELADAIRLGDAARRIGGPKKDVGFARLT
jgi:glutamate-1-semialdehyde aminotransferase